MTGYIEKIIEEVSGALMGVCADECERLAQAVISADRVFVAGAGRSGLMMRCFAMRLTHMGMDAYVVGETTAPGIAGADLLVIGSGSGRTAGLEMMAQKAKRLGAGVALVTIFPSSAIGAHADHILRLPAQPKSGEAAGGGSVQPMGSLFEQSLLLLLDSVILLLMDKLKITSQSMYGRHANLE